MIKIKQWIINMSLNKKFMTIIMCVVLAMMIAAYIAIHIVNQSYQEMLYEVQMESLEYSAKEMTDYMQKMENLTMMMLSDKEIQEALNNVKNNDAKSLEAMNAIKKIRSSVGLYYQSFSDGILKYITLYMDSANAYTNILEADKVPEEIQSQMVAVADEQKGKPCWITDYVEEFGLFLVRSVRSIQSYKLERIGTLLLKIDMEALVNSETRLKEKYGDTGYLVCDGEDVLFHTKNISKESIELIRNTGISEYQILRLEEHSYFVVCGELEHYGWDYYCLVSYDSMRKRFVQVSVVGLLIILPVIFLASGLSCYLINNIIRHIKSLTAKMKQFAENNTKMPDSGYDYTSRKDELGLLHRQFDQMSETIIGLIQENYINELVRKETQIKALENQMNPHFLYNTLESINWRAKAAGEKEISSMVEALGTLLRTNLSHREGEIYSLEKEMNVIGAYITIQRFRYEERLNFRNNIDSTYYSMQISRLSLQPLVENAVYYGVETNVDGAEIEISLKIENDTAHFFVKNTGSEMEERILEKLETGEIIPSGHGIGLLNTDKRIKMQFGDSYGLTLYNEEEYAVAELKIPIEAGEKHVEVDYCR